MNKEQLLESLSNCLNIDTQSGTLYVYGSLQQGAIKSSVLYADADGKIIASPSGSGGSSTSTFTTNVTAPGFIKSGGTSAQFLMADGSVSTISSGTVTTALGYTPYNATNPTGYLNTTSANAIYLRLIGGTLTGSLTATAFFESSDFRLKKLIEHNPIVAGIENLQAKLYEKDGKVELGYFAQDAEKIMPYAVTEDTDGLLSLSYREVHTAKIARLEKELEELKAKLNSL